MSKKGPSKEQWEIIYFYATHPNVPPWVRTRAQLYLEERDSARGVSAYEGLTSSEPTAQGGLFLRPAEAASGSNPETVTASLKPGWSSPSPSQSQANGESMSLFSDGA